MEEYNLDMENKKSCWIFKYNCHARTGTFRGVVLPYTNCHVYRWFKEIIEWQKKNRPDYA